MGRCRLCHDAVSDDRLGVHLRLVHPEEYGDGFEEWPDGAPVVVDKTLAPDDFEGSESR